MTATGADRPRVVPSNVVVGGHQLRVRRAGSGRPVLLIHGIPTSSLLWRHVHQPLIPHADVVAVDLLGYGESDKPGTPSPTLAVQVDLLSELLRMWDLRNVVVVGHDIGGGVAQLLAVREPERVSALLLVDSIAYDSFPEPTIARLADPGWDQRIQEIELAAGLERSLRKGITNPDGAATTELAALYAAPFEGPTGRAAYLRAARALRTDDLLSVMPAVEALTIPVRLLWGENDPFQPVEYGKRLATALADATLTIVPDGRHFLPEDHPQAVVDATLELLGLTTAEAGRTR